MTSARPLVAGLDRASVEAIVDAYGRGEPVGLVHDRLPPDERAALAARLAAAPVPDGTAFVVFTSGSTGRPKGVVLSRAAAAASVAASAAHLGTRAGDRWLLALSPAHAGGLNVVLRALAARALDGMPLVIAAGGDARSVAAALDAERPTLVSLVPTQLAGLLADPAWHPPASLRAVLLGGAAATPALLAAARDRGVPVHTTYGMTETFGQAATAPAPITLHPPPDGAIGRALPGVTIDAGTRAAPAPIVVHTPAAYTCYLDDPRAEAPEVVTADLGFVEDGWLYVVGRADDVIITGGEKVHPLAVEAALARVPGVAAVCVAGVPDETWGARVAAAIVATPALDRAALDAAIAALAPHARPRIVRFTDRLPLGPTGKPDRAATRAWLSACAS